VGGYSVVLCSVVGVGRPWGVDGVKKKVLLCLCASFVIGVKLL
jgi:hypothetical protein